MIGYCVDDAHHPTNAEKSLMPHVDEKTKLMFEFIRMPNLDKNRTLFIEVIKMLAAAGANVNAKTNSGAPFMQVVGENNQNLLYTIISLAKEGVAPFSEIDFKSQATPKYGIGFLSHLASNRQTKTDEFFYAIDLAGGYVEPYALANMISRGRNSMAVAVARRLVEKGETLKDKGSHLWGYFIAPLTSVNHASAMRDVIDAIGEDVMISIPKMDVSDFKPKDYPILRVIAGSASFTDEYVLKKSRESIEAFHNKPRDVLAVLRRYERLQVASCIEADVLKRACKAQPAGRIGVEI